MHERLNEDALNTDYIKSVFEAAQVPYQQLIQQASKLGLNQYIGQLEHDGKVAAEVQTLDYLVHVSESQIDDPVLAWNLAHAEDESVEAKRALDASNINEKTRHELIEQIEMQHLKEEQESIDAYKAAGLRYLETRLEKIDTADTVLYLEQMSDDELEAKYDTRPLNKADIANIEPSKVNVSRIWNAFVKLARGEKQNMVNWHDPKLVFGTIPGIIKEGSNNKIVREEARDLEFKSLYNFVQWIDEKSKSGQDYATFLPRGVGQKVMSTCKLLIASRERHILSDET